MDFFARQEKSRRTTRVLVAVFLAAFLIVALLTTLAVAVGIRTYTENHALFLGTASFGEWIAAHSMLLAGIAAGTFGVMSVASFGRAASLAAGGAQVARMLGATEINADDTDPLRRRLVNVVEEMSIASGMPVPTIFVLEQEAGINAFAAGLTPANAAIAVTRGALEKLERAELQGVIAHEFSHIANGDMRLNQQLIGMSFGILVLSLVGRWLLRSARFGRFSRGKNSGGVAAALAIGLALTVIGAIGVLLARIIKAAVSRERERLADASAVQFTREPSGLAGALQKIGEHTGELKSVETEEIAHMLFARGAWSFRGLFATHPPLAERIGALDPSLARTLTAGTARAAAGAGAERGVSSLAGSAGGAVAAPAAPRDAAPAPGNPLERAGTMERAEVGGALRAQLPDEIVQAAHSREASLLLVLALALADDESTRARQLALLDSQLGATRASLCRRLRDDVARLDASLKLPMLELAVPALKQRPAVELDYLFELLARLASVDAEPRLFDWVLVRALAAYLGRETLADHDAARVPNESAALATVLATVAAYGHDDAQAAAGACRAGWATLGAAGERHARDAVPAGKDLRALDTALGKLAALKPSAKRKVLLAVLATIRHDHTVTLAETELFRAIAAVLDCPIPPSVPSVPSVPSGAEAVRLPEARQSGQS